MHSLHPAPPDVNILYNQSTIIHTKKFTLTLWTMNCPSLGHFLILSLTFLNLTLLKNTDQLFCKNIPQFELLCCSSWLNSGMRYQSYYHRSNALALSAHHIKEAYDVEMSNYHWCTLNTWSLQWKVTIFLFDISKCLCEDTLRLYKYLVSQHVFIH